MRERSLAIDGKFPCLLLFVAVIAAFSGERVAGASETCAIRQENLLTSELNPSILTSDVEALRQKIGPKVIVFLGPPGAGKGTQAKVVSKMLGIPHISTGDLFRAVAKDPNSDLGRLVSSYMNRGELVPAQIANEVLISRLSQSDCSGGFILDGFPRTKENAVDLESILERINRRVDVVIHFDVSEAEVLDHLTGRRVCSSCGQSYHIAYIKPKAEGVCDSCGEGLVTRADDQEAVIRKRREVYNAETAPLVDLFFKQDKLYTVTGAERPEDVTSQIFEALIQSSQGAVPAAHPYDKLKARLRDPKYGVDQAALTKLATEFRDESLELNERKRTGVMRRFVYAATSNPKKLQEYVKIFDLYGVEVLQAPEEINAAPFDAALLKAGTADLVPLGIIRETSNVYRPGTKILSSLRDGVEAENRSDLEAKWIDNGALVTKKYSVSTLGNIDHSKGRSKHDSLSFGWDDLFVVKALGKTYRDLNAEEHKISSRDQTISRFIHDRIHYKSPKDWKHDPQSPKRAIDFSKNLGDVLAKNTYFQSSRVREYGFWNLVHKVLNDGVFLKAAENRRQGNYWLPTWNGGLPLTAKSDSFHQTTFFTHDTGHLAIRDLTYTGRDTLENRQVYIAHRMMSEACTLVWADMLFVDAQVRDGLSYDFSKRKIYPLFTDLGIDFTDKANFLRNLKTLLRASVAYTLEGDDSHFRRMLENNGKGTENLEAFKKKYMPFFVEDFRWTERNYDNMAKKSDEIRRWWTDTAEVRTANQLNYETIDDFALAIRGSDGSLIDRVFERVFEKNIRPIFETVVEPFPRQTQLKNGFLRYMIGQMAIFSRFQAIPETNAYRARLIEHLKANSNEVTLDAISGARAIYEEYLALLRSKNLITEDDEVTFKETYPIFDPFYVSYDKGQGSYEDLAQVSKRTLSEEAYRAKQIGQIEASVQRKLSPKEIQSAKTMIGLVEAGGGQIEQGLFVSRPGVAIIAESRFDVSRYPLELAAQLGAPMVKAASTSVTFLLAGIGIETSLELLAHGEASVARLTTSKTQAMSVPLFRVQGERTQAQKDYAQGVLAYRAEFERMRDPRTTWDSGHELFNVTNAGNKTTALTYTMTLADYHKLFIGRIPVEGNETEVREVVRRMCTILHEAYPEIIRAPEEYEKMGNGSKYVGVKSAPLAADFSSAQRALIEMGGGQMGADGRVVAPGAVLVGNTGLTPDGMRIFKKLNIDSSSSESDQLGEFRSRITYLSFSNTKGVSADYNKRMIRDLQHLSVTSATRANMILAGVSATSAYDLAARCAQLGGGSSMLAKNGMNEPTTILLTLSLKSYRKLLNDLRAQGEHDEDAAKIAAKMHGILHESFDLVFP